MKNFIYSTVIFLLLFICSAQSSLYAHNTPTNFNEEVKYASIGATTYTNGVIVSWEILNNNNSDYFEVERSFDFTSFKTIGMVLDAEKVLNNSGSYRFKDNASILKGKETVYYRLKQIDKNGSINYSDIITVKIKQSTTTDAKVVSLNLLDDNATLTYTSSSNQTASIRVFNAAGQIVINRQVVVNKGVNNLSISQIAQLPTGSYIVNVMADNKLVGSQKIIKQ